MTSTVIANNNISIMSKYPWNLKHYPIELRFLLVRKLIFESLCAKKQTDTRLRLFKKYNEKYREWIYSFFRENQKDLADGIYENWSNGIYEENAPVFTFWYQGLANCPDIVRLCIESMRKHIKGHPLIVITQDNISDFITFPRYIQEKLEKGIITLTHFSDILRFSLLEKYGGLWLDATVFLSNDIGGGIFESPLFTVRAETDKFKTLRYLGSGFWCGFIFGGHKGNTQFKMMNSLFLDYWAHNNVMVDYFLIDLYLSFLYKNYPNVRSMIDILPDKKEKIFLLSSHLSERADEKLLQSFESEIPVFSKLSYKLNFPLPDDSIYYWLMKNGIRHDGL